MKLLSNLRIGAKLYIGFGVCLALAATIAITAIRGMGGMQTVSARITTDALQGAHDLGTLSSGLMRLRRDYLKILFSANDQDRGALVETAGQSLGDIKKSTDAYGSSINSQEDQKNFNELKGHLDTYPQDYAQLKALVAAGSLEKARTLYKGK